MLKTLILERISEEGLNILNSFSSVETFYEMKRNEILQKIKYFDIIIIKSTVIIDSEFLSRTKKLVLLGRAGTGIDNIDLKLLEKNKIKFIHCPGINAVATSEFIICMVLNLIKEIHKIKDSISKNNFSRHVFQMRQLDSMKIGIIGLGEVGVNLTKRLSAFNATIFGYDISKKNKKTFLSFGGEFVENINQLLKKSNIIILCANLNRKSKNIINKVNYRYINKGSYLINCARAKLMDQDIILKALNENILKSVAIDLIAPEPIYKNEKQKLHDLFYHPNVFYTPHLASLTQETQLKMSVFLAKKIKDYFKNKTF